MNAQGFPEVDHVELFGPPRDAGANTRNFVLCPGKAYDRSPCGTGTSAKLACLAADGKLAEGEAWVQESIIGSTFSASFRWLDRARGEDRAHDQRQRLRQRGEHAACSTSAIRSAGESAERVHRRLLSRRRERSCRDRRRRRGRALHRSSCALRGWRVTVVERNAEQRDGCSFGNAGMIVPSHFVPLAAPGMVALGLKWMWNPASPFYVKPRAVVGALRLGAEILARGERRARAPRRAAAARPEPREPRLLRGARRAAGQRFRPREERDC